MHAQMPREDVHTVWMFGGCHTTAAWVSFETFNSYKNGCRKKRGAKAISGPLKQHMGALQMDGSSDEAFIDWFT